jgi:16S rRNA (cytidine1402-2'-O)-methyltransferase
LAARTRLCIAADLTLDTETIDCRPVSRWRGDDGQRFDRRPAIFLLQG